MTQRGPFQPLPFCDSVIHHEGGQVLQGGAQSRAGIYLLRDSPSFSRGTGMHSSHSGCPSPTELPLLKLSDAQPARRTTASRLRVGLHKRTAGLKAKKSHLHRECKGQAVVCRTSPGEKTSLFLLCLNSPTLLNQSITVESDSPLAQSLPWCCHPTPLTDPGTSWRLQLRFGSLSLPPLIHSRPTRHASGRRTPLRLPR